MQPWQAIILGIVEGLTEFLPVSSTFHLLMAERLLHISRSQFTDLFVVVIQMFTMIPLLFIFGKEWFADKKLIVLTLLGFVPTALIGFVGYKLIKGTFFGSPYLMISVFIGLGLLFLLVEWYIKRTKAPLDRDLKHLTYGQAILIGIAQGCAVIPGVSRSGGIIIVMLLLGFKRIAAARFSFMLAVPTLAVAGLYDLYKVRDVVVAQSGNSLLLMIGAFFASISAWLVVKLLLAYVQKHDFRIFGWYRIVVGLLLLLGLLWGS